MGTLIREIDEEPENSEEPDYIQGPSGQWYVLTELEGRGKTMLGANVTYTPLSRKEVRSLGVDGWTERFGDLFLYYFVVSKSNVDGLRDFVATSNAGQLPDSWTEQAATTADGEDYFFITVKASINEARSLGSAQRAIEKLSSLPGEIEWYQTVNKGIEDYSGLTKISRYPTLRGEDLYLPGELYQTGNADLSADRGTAVGQQRVLDEHNLTLD